MLALDNDKFFLHVAWYSANLSVHATLVLTLVPHFVFTNQRFAQLDTHK